MTQIPNAPLPTEKVIVSTSNRKNSSTGFLGNFKVPQKLILLTAAIAIPAVIISSILGTNYYNDYQEANAKANVAAAYAPLQSLQQSARVIQGRQPADVTPDMINNLKTSSEGLVATLKRTNLSTANKLADDITQKTNQIINGISNRTINFQNLLSTSTELLANDVNPLFSLLADQGGLLHSRDARDFEMADLSSRLLPTILPNTGHEFDNILAVSEKARTEQKGKLTDAQRVDIQNRIDMIRNQLQQIDTYSTTIMQKYPDLTSSLKEPVNKALSATRDAYNQLENDILKAPTVARSRNDFLKLPVTYLPLQYGGFSAVVNSMDAGFKSTANRARDKMLVLLFSLLALAILLIWLINAILRAITNPLQQLTLASQRLSAGDFSSKVAVNSRDELGTLARSFNNASEQLHANELRVQQEREEAARLQGNIGEFLDVTMDIAEGDLTKRGKVTEDVLGNVVDSVNLMAEELAVVLKDVQNASNSVAGGSRAMLSTTEQINQGTQLTATEAERVAQQVQELTAAIREMAQSAQTSAETARQALQASQQGQEAVSGTLEGMQNVRREVQDIAKRVKGLGDRSLEIQEIVDTIGQIARQTNLLALNAAIEAAGAGEAGGRFTIVADEVRKLADTSGQATARIAALIKNVQSEIQDVVVRVEEGTREVEQGYRVAGTAGERLREIGTLSERSAALAEQISQATQEQVRGIEQMGQAVAQINNIAQESTQSVEEGRAAAEQLQQLAGRLNTSLGRFRLPE